MAKPTIRNWATPLAIGAFLVSAATGVLIFFHIEIGLVEPVHKWLSWLLVGGVALHTAANWKGFQAHLSSRAGRAIMGTAALLTLFALSPFAGGKDEGPDRKALARAAVGMLEEATLESLAPLLQAAPAQLQAELLQHGIEADEPTLTLRDIAAFNDCKESDVLGALLASRLQQEKPDDQRH